MATTEERPAPESLKRRLRSGERLVGALVRMPSEELVEMLGVAALDFVLIDCEHGPADVLALRQHIALAHLHGMGVLVRVGSDEDALVLRALDQGAQGIVAPHVDTAEDAARLVRAAHYPPLGERGFATYPRAGRFGTVAPAAHAQAAEESTLVVAMLESHTAVRSCAEILSTPGIDAYLVGAADLSASSTADDPSLAQATEAIRACAATTSALRIDLAGGADAARAALADGADLVVYNLTQVLMETVQGLRL